MEFIGPFVQSKGPLRTVCVAQSFEHLYFIHRYRPSSYLLGLPANMKWNQMDECRKRGIELQRLCSTMGKPNPIWCLEIAYYTPIKRVLIEDRLITFESKIPTIEVVNRVEN